MIKDLNNKHLLIIGENFNDRHKYINELVKDTNKIIYRFQPNIQTFDKYIEQVRKLFPFIPTNWKEQNPNKWTRNQVWDFHLNWTEKTHSILIIIEELGQMEENWRLEIIRHYMTTSYHQEYQNIEKINFQLIISQDSDDDLIEKLVPIFGLKDNEKRSELSIILGKLTIINLNLK
ncbi:MAG: hypothetical protein PHV20_04630 [Bacteroidales bacterium]|nr:hypothetical protein [Bacteroidales bacterium]